MTVGRTFVIEGERLVFETTSRQRAERGRRLLEGLVGDAVRLRTTRLQDAGQALRAAPPPEPRPAEIPPEVEAQVVFEFYERHYRCWPDTPLPALGGRTPRQAARLKDSPYRREEFGRRRRVRVEGQDLSVAAPEDLIISKLDWARGSWSEVQLGDVRDLLASVPNLDEPYLARWTHRLGLDALYREVRA